MNASGLGSMIRDVPDFPEPGIVFKDITPLLRDHEALSAAVEALAAPFVDSDIDQVLGIESRGFILAVPVALRLDAGFVPIRKAGKLPSETRSASYELEYGVDELEIHADAVGAGDRILLLDDVIATGGTASAALSLIRSLGAEVVGMAVLIELVALDGRARLGDLPFHAVLSNV